MSHYITVPIDASGVIDPDGKVQDIVRQAMSSAFSTADAALKNYNVTTAGFNDGT